MIRLPRKEPNAIVKGEDWNLLVDLLNTALTIKVGPGLESRYTDSGIYVTRTADWGNLHNVQHPQNS